MALNDIVVSVESLVKQYLEESLKQLALDYGFEPNDIIATYGKVDLQTFLKRPRAPSKRKTNSKENPAKEKTVSKSASRKSKASTSKVEPNTIPETSDDSVTTVQNPTVSTTDNTDDESVYLKEIVIDDTLYYLNESDGNKLYMCSEDNKNSDGDPMFECIGILLANNRIKSLKHM